MQTPRLLRFPASAASRSRCAAPTSLGPAAGQPTEFELARPDRLDEASVETAPARNRAFATAHGHEEATVFPTLRMLVITCLDP